MTSHQPGSVLSLQGVALSETHVSTGQARISLDLRRGHVALIQVDDPADASLLIDVSLGLLDPPAGRASFLGVDWMTQRPRERLRRRRRIGAVVQADTWPSNMTVEESILLAWSSQLDQTRADLLADATDLARLFGLPGLPVGARETMRMPALVRAACVRGFVGTRDLMVVQDPTLERMADLALPLAQAIATMRARGGSVLWLVSSLEAQAAAFVLADQVFRLDGHGLLRAGNQP